MEGCRGFKKVRVLNLGERNTRGKGVQLRGLLEDQKGVTGVEKKVRTVKKRRGNNRVKNKLARLLIKPQRSSSSLARGSGADKRRWEGVSSLVVGKEAGIN